MAVVIVMPHPDAANVIRYAFRDRESGDPVISELCSDEAEPIIQEFKAIRNLHNHKKGNMEVFHIIQSWGPQDAGKITPALANKLGYELVKEHFAGHQFVVVTHTDADNLHNHVIVNALHMQSGNRAQSKFKHWHALVKVNDRLSLEHGLHVIDRAKSKEKDLNLSAKPRRMVKEGRESYIFDLAQKAAWASHFSRSYDEYALYLSAFGIRVQVEEKNITYFYPGRERGKRGSKLGRVFDKAGLEKKFKTNDTKYLEHPELLAALKGGDASVQAAWAAELKLRAEVRARLPNNYGAYSRTARKGRESTAHESTAELNDSLIPPETIEKARMGNILHYCRDNGIALLDMGEGKFKLKGREHVILTAHESVNTKNRSRGNLIDFVAAHKRVTYLRAISEITGNQRLLLLAHKFDAPGRIYNSFLIPNQRLESEKDSKKKLMAFLKARGASERVADTLLKKQQAQVERGGGIHLFPRGEPTGSLEYEPSDDKKEPKKHGQFRTPFFSSRGAGSKAVVFTDPLSFIQKRGEDVFSDAKRKDGLLALMEPDAEKVHQYVVENEHVRQLHIVRFTHRPPTKVELDFFENLKGSLAKLNIEVHAIAWDQALEREGPSLSL